MLRQKAEYEIFTLSRHPASDIKTKHFVAEALDEKSLRDIVLTVKPKIIVNFIGASTSTEALVELTRINTGVILNLVSILGIKNLSETRIITMGSAAEYGGCSGKLISEEEPARPVSAYGISKLAQTAIAKQFNESLGSRIDVVRPFNLIGANSPESLISQKICRKVLALESSENLYLDDAEMERDFVDIDDFTKGLLNLIETECLPGVFNVCSGKAVSLRSLAEAFMIAGGKSGKVLQSPQSKFRSPVRRAVGDSTKMSGATGWVVSKTLQQAASEQIKTAASFF
ncbi:GDP-6-deoxy-D-mannose reductase [Oceaniferula spumae]|uniref:GDP-6-deoxy-D-mannose reductase n=1 Tax=Oceaniferula spumae TaxID=2979115 RepID=A0AAT9FLC8_9BACT